MNATSILRNWLPCLALALLLGGCATNKIDWAGRIGHYTFDDAVLELGPPDKREKLSNGILVAEWLTRRGYAVAYPAYGWAHPYYYGPGYSNVAVYPNYFLRLTFGADGQL